MKLTFASGAALADPAGLFNASLDAGTRRAIDLHEGDELDREAFVDLIRRSHTTGPDPAAAPGLGRAARIAAWSCDWAGTPLPATGR